MYWFALEALPTLFLPTSPVEPISNEKRKKKIGNICFLFLAHIGIIHTSLLFDDLVQSIGGICVYND